MQLSHSLMAALGLSLAASAAQACPSPAFQSSLFFEKAPLWAPAGETVLKVRVREVTGGRTPSRIGYRECVRACSAVLEVLEVARGRTPPPATVRLEPQVWTSCSAPISVGDEGYVAGVMEIDRGVWRIEEPRAERAQARAERLAAERVLAPRRP